ncbi:MAG TPA: DNA-formamidopyrimidine glycosylase family protein [Burkholderiaceae bacterium]|nr:DNA-formamidopyrimidine glycosylase family protein [Burkholderiaceae bacterium]
MPELPDVVVYVEAVHKRLIGKTLVALSIPSPFLLRTAVPPVSTLTGRRVAGVRRIGKRIVLEFEGRLFAVLHLMIAGRLHWVPQGARARSPPRNLLARFEFDDGALTLTEAGTRKRASLHVVDGEIALAALDPGGIDVATASPEVFRERLIAENHTVKRALTDPRVFSGIGNAYSDEILHRAQLSPFALTRKLTAEQIGRLHRAASDVLAEWTERLRAATGDGFPGKVTAFRPEMAVHGKFGQPCPVCGAPVQRIVYAENETNYCARCQTGGTILADRSLSRLLKASWPRSIDELG